MSDTQSEVDLFLGSFEFNSLTTLVNTANWFASCQLWFLNMYDIMFHLDYSLFVIIYFKWSTWKLPGWSS